MKGELVRNAKSLTSLTTLTTRAENVDGDSTDIISSAIRLLQHSGGAAMPFAKGQSGNPGGKAKVLADGRTLTDLARDHTERAVTALADVLDSADASDAAKVSAATAILDRGWGRPKQDLGIEMKSDGSTAAMLEAARKRAAVAVLPAD